MTGTFSIFFFFLKFFCRAVRHRSGGRLVDRRCGRGKLAKPRPLYRTHPSSNRLTSIISRSSWKKQSKAKKKSTPRAPKNKNSNQVHSRWKRIGWVIGRRCPLTTVFMAVGTPWKCLLMADLYDHSFRSKTTISLSLARSLMWCFKTRPPLIAQFQPEKKKRRRRRKNKSNWACLLLLSCSFIFFRYKFETYRYTLLIVERVCPVTTHGEHTLGFPLLLLHSLEHSAQYNSARLLAEHCH